MDENTFFISAKTGYGTKELLDGLKDIFEKGSRMIDILIPYTEGDLLNRIHREGNIISESYEEGGTHIIASCPDHLAKQIDKIFNENKEDTNDF